jgi:hypothetical protein
LPPERFAPLGDVFPPELCSPAAVYLAHEACPLNGVMLVCGGGQVMRMGFKQNQGLTSPALSVEEIAENIGRIIDTSESVDVEVGMVRRS